MDFLCKVLSGTYKRLKLLFLKYSKSFKDIKDEIPLPIMPDHTWFVTDRSLSRILVFNCFILVSGLRGHVKSVHRKGPNIMYR